MSSLELRPADPTQADGLRFGSYLDQAAGGLFRMAIGSVFDSVLARAFRTPGHDLSYEHVTFAVHGDAPVGMASAYTFEQHRTSSDWPLIRAAGLRTIRMGALAILGFTLLRFLDTLDPGDCYLQAIAVDEASRGGGIGSELMDHVEDEARAKGCAQLSLDVALENEAARRLYRRRGLEELRTSPSVLFMPETRVVRMAKAL